MLQATSSGSAIEAAEKEALEYAQTVNSEYMNYADSYHLFDKDLANGVEVFSLMRKTDMSADEYLDHFLDTGIEQRSN